MVAAQILLLSTFMELLKNLQNTFEVKIRPQFTTNPNFDIFILIK